MNILRLPTYILKAFIGFFVVVAAFFAIKPIVRGVYQDTMESARQQWIENIKDNSASGFFTPCNDDHLLWYLKVRRKRFDIKPGVMDGSLLKPIEELISSWPKGLQRYMNEHVREILVVKNFGASGHIYTYDNTTFTIVIDESVIGMRPNEWFRMKEKTIVKTEQISLLHRMEYDSTNMPERLLESILIHEIAHCIGVSEGWTTDLKGRTELPSKMRVFDGVFELPESRPVMIGELRNKFPKLRYYKEEGLLTADEYVKLLGLLENSQFPTLYGTVSDLEFFAEYFYAYIHCQEQNRPLSYLVVNGKDTLAHVKSPIFESINSGRLNLMAEVLSGLVKEAP